MTNNEVIGVSAKLPRINDMPLYFMPYTGTMFRSARINDEWRAMMNAIAAMKYNEDEVRYWYLRRFASNNWLRMHGYPMRRKGH